MSNVTIQGKNSSNRTKPQEIYSTDNAAHVHLASTDVTSCNTHEIVELLNAAALAGTVTSNLWINTENLIDGLVHWATSAAQTGNITAYYSFDGISSVHSETVKALSGGAAETHALGFNDFDAGADAAGFTRNIKLYPFVTFGLASGAGTGTMDCKVSVVRRG